MERTLQFERMCQEFFLLAKHHIRERYKPDTCDAFTKWNDDDKKVCSHVRAHTRVHTQLVQFADALTTFKSRAHTALCDNIDTYTVMESMRELIATGNAYIKLRTPHPNAVLLYNTVEYMTRLLRMFGAIETPAELGFACTSSSAGGDIDTLLQPYLECLRNFRGAVRTAAQQVKAVPVLDECDRLRDDILPELGVRLEDQGNDQPAIIKLADKDCLLREREQRQRIEADKRAAAEVRQRQAEEAAAKKGALLKIKPNDLFRSEADAASKYSKYDDNGIPTHDAAGEELSKKLRRSSRNNTKHMRRSTIKRMPDLILSF